MTASESSTQAPPAGSPLTVAERAQRLWENHETEIIYEDDLYRHISVRLRFLRFWVGVMTWPWHLTITGSCGGGWTFFGRSPDMLHYFSQADKDPTTGERTLPLDKWAAMLTPIGREVRGEYEDDFALTCHLLHLIACEYQYKKGQHP